MKKIIFWCYCSTFLTLSLPSILVAQPLSLIAKDKALTEEIKQAIKESELTNTLAVGVVDLTNPEKIKWGGVNEQTSFYAASVAKIAILLGAFEKNSNDISFKNIFGHSEFQNQLRLMATYSNNQAASLIYGIVGPKSIQQALLKYHLYHPRFGGLWAGGLYSGDLSSTFNNFVKDSRLDVTLDPLSSYLTPSVNGLTHEVTVEALLNFFLLMNQEKLVNENASKEMKKFLQNGISKWCYDIKHTAGGFLNTCSTKVGYIPGILVEATLVEGKGFRYIIAAASRYSYTSESDADIQSLGFKTISRKILQERINNRRLDIEKIYNDIGVLNDSLKDFDYNQFYSNLKYAKKLSEDCLSEGRLTRLFTNSCTSFVNYLSERLTNDKFFYNEKSNLETILEISELSSQYNYRHKHFAPRFAERVGGRLNKFYQAYSLENISKGCGKKRDKDNIDYVRCLVKNLNWGEEIKDGLSLAYTELSESKWYDFIE